MAAIDFGRNCRLIIFMKELWTVDFGCKGQFAGFLLHKLGYPYFNQSPDIHQIAHFVQETANIKQANALLSKSKEICVDCPHSTYCDVSRSLK